MREILFRGKRVDNGEWVYGYYTCFNEKECRIYSGYAETDCGDYYPDESSKVSMYNTYQNRVATARDSYNRAVLNYNNWFNIISETVGQYTGLTVPSGRIFEHDIVTAKFKSNGARFNFIVKYSGEKGCYIFDNGSVKVPFCNIRSVRVIGNIHDNPELLRKEDGK